MKKIGRSAISETKASYEAVMKTKQTSKAPEEYVEDVKEEDKLRNIGRELQRFSKEVWEFHARVYGDYPEMWEIGWESAIRLSASSMIMTSG